jgi:predicted transcriptional regulator
MTRILRTPDLTLGELEREVLNCLWEVGALSPNAVHEAVGTDRGIAVNTVCSALKRLFEKGLLEREKVSHSYVYSAAVTRAELQRQLIGAITDQFGERGGTAFLAAFVDLAEQHGKPMLQRLEAMASARLREDSDD